MNDSQVFQQSLELANVLKLSDEELPVLIKQFALTGDTESNLRELQQRFDLTAIAYTRGEQGAVLLRGDEISRCEGYPTKVIELPAKSPPSFALKTGQRQKSPPLY